MKVVLLAGGRGIRGKPFTNYSPKSMIPILGRPVIDHIVRFVSKFTCVSEILVVCEKDSFGSQIINYFEGKDRLLQKKITFIEDSKNGTGGALLLCRKYLEKESHFLVWYADNLCALDVHDLEQKFFTLQTEKGHDTIKYIVITRSSRVEETGRVFIRKRHLNNLYIASNFVEKPLIEIKDQEASGIYMFNDLFFDVLKAYSISNKTKVFDIASHILTYLNNQDRATIYSYNLTEVGVDWVDIESPTYVERNAYYVSSIVKQMNVFAERTV